MNQRTNNAVALHVLQQHEPRPRHPRHCGVGHIVDAAGTTKYTYTAAGLLWTEDGPFSSDTVTNIYLNRMRTNMVLQQPTALWTNAFQYAAAKRLTSTISPAGTFTYTLGGPSSSSAQIKKLALPNTAYITNTYDNVAPLTGTYLKNSGHTILDSATYGYNQGKQRTSFTKAAGTYCLYTYDPIGQLKVGDSSINTEDRGYLYDAAWNLTQRTNNGAVSTLIYDNKNEVTNAFSGTYTYDANGNPTYFNASGSKSYSYDDENRLTSVSMVNTWRSDFTYDGLGRMRTRLEYTWNGSSWILNTTTYYIYDGMRVIQERTSSPTVSYTRGPDLSGTMEGAGGIGGLLARSSGYSSGNWTAHHFYHADGNGNITYLVDSSQALAASYRYDPFGNTISSSGTLAAANVYRFSSKEVHVNSGMYYYGYRFYDPNLQRWLNRDPVDEWGGANLYAFLRNGPLEHIDPLGLEDKKGDKGFLGGLWDWLKDVPKRVGDAASCVKQWCKSGAGTVAKLPTTPANAAAGAATRVIGTVSSGAKAGAGMTAIAAMEQYCGKCKWCLSQTFDPNDPADCQKQKDCDDACKKCEEMKAKLPAKAL